MKLESIKVNGEELGKEEIADLFVNRPRNGYYVKGLAEDDEVMVSASFDALPIDLKFKGSSAIIYFGFYKLVYNDKESSSVAQYLQLAHYPVKLLFHVKRIGGYNRLILRGFAYHMYFDDECRIGQVAENDVDDKRLREEVQKDQDEEQGTGGRYDK